MIGLKSNGSHRTRNDADCYCRSEHLGEILPAIGYDEVVEGYDSFRVESVSDG